MESIITSLQSFDFSSILKLILGFTLAGIIGLERDYRNKPAGFRTHGLVGISAVLVVLCGEYMAVKYNTDPSRIPAQLLSGIGFIGAGTILRDGFNVKGLTTASSLLAVTCIGLCIGCGFYFGAIVATLITFVVLSYSYKLTDKLDHFNNVKLLICLNDTSSNIVEEIESILDEYDIEIKKIEKSDENDLHIDIRYNKTKTKINRIITKLSNLTSIKSIEEE